MAKDVALFTDWYVLGFKKNVQCVQFGYSLKKDAIKTLIFFILDNQIVKATLSTYCLIKYLLLLVNNGKNQFP